MESPVKLGGRRRPRRRPSARSVKPMDYDVEPNQDGAGLFSSCFGNKCDVVEPIRAETFSKINPARASSSRWAESITSLLIDGFETLNVALRNAIDDYSKQQPSFIDHLNTYEQQLTQLNKRFIEMKEKSIPIYSSFFISYLDRFISQLSKINATNMNSALRLTQELKETLDAWPSHLRLEQTEAIQTASKAYITALTNKTRVEEKTKIATQSALRAAQNTRQIIKEGQKSKNYEVAVGTSSRQTVRAQSAVEKATADLASKIDIVKQAREQFINQLGKQEALQIEANATAARTAARSLSRMARTESAVKRSEALLKKTLSSIPEARTPATGGRKKPAKKRI